MNAKHFYWKTALFCSLILSLVIPASAADSVDIKLPVSQKIVMEDSNDTPETVTFHYELSTEQEDAPMPEGSVEGEYVFTIHGMDGKVTIPLHFTHAGIYHYTIHQIDENTQYYICDDTYYEVTVYVQNEPSGDLGGQIIVEDEADGKKCGEILFRTVFRDIPGNTPDQSEPENPAPDNSQNPDNSSPASPSSPESSTPQTGDSSAITVWMLMAGFSAAVLISLLILRKFQRK